MDEIQLEELDYEQALVEVKRIVKHVTNETIIEPESSFDHDFIVIAKTMLKLERALQNQVDNE